LCRVVATRCNVRTPFLIPSRHTKPSAATRFVLHFFSGVSRTASPNFPLFFELRRSTSVENPSCDAAEGWATQLSQLICLSHSTKPWLQFCNSEKTEKNLPGSVVTLYGSSGFRAGRAAAKRAQAPSPPCTQGVRRVKVCSKGAPSKFPGWQDGRPHAYQPRGSLECVI